MSRLVIADVNGIRFKFRVIEKFLPENTEYHFQILIKVFKGDSVFCRFRPEYIHGRTFNNSGLVCLHKSDIVMLLLDVMSEREKFLALLENREKKKREFDEEELV